MNVHTHNYLNNILAVYLLWMGVLGRAYSFLLSVAYRLASRIQTPFYQSYLLRTVRSGPIPKHVALILDGNRRFASAVGLSLEESYYLGARKVEEILSWCEELGIEHVTLYSFSTENFNRPRDQVEAVMNRIREELKYALSRIDEFKRRGVRVRVIGRKELLPDDIKVLAERLERETSGNRPKTVNIALAYGGRDEILDAVRKIALEVQKGAIKPSDINEELFEKYLYLNGVPEPDLIIRTSGEERISNFLLWHIAYSELYFCEAYLPSFRKIDFLRAIRDYQRRSRRFGK